MSTQLILVADERGFTVQLSTTHQTQAGALAHFTEMLAQLHHQHPATIAATLASPAEASDPEPPSDLSTWPHSVYRNFANGREEPPF